MRSLTTLRSKRKKNSAPFVYSRSETALSANLGEEMVLLDMRRSHYIGLNVTAT